jgi:hypothetical protein
MIRVRSVTPLDSYNVRVTFTDESEKIVDLAPYLLGPTFEPLKNVL